MKGLFPLIAVVALTAVLGWWYAHSSSPSATAVFRFEDDEGNYRDGYDEPGVAFYSVTVEARESRYTVVDPFTGNRREGLTLDQATQSLREVLKPHLKSYDPATGTIKDRPTDHEAGNDEFQNFDTLLREDLERLAR